MLTKFKTHCKKGHEYTDEGTFVRKNGTRLCLFCKRSGEKERAHRYPLRAKRKNVKANFGISLEEYNERLLFQDNLCALCKTPFLKDETKEYIPVLDHNHSTDKVREFLHNRCNKALGLLNDSPEVCRMAAEYLEKHQEIKNVSE